MTENRADRLISALGKRIGIPQCQLDARGCCSLMLDGHRQVDLRYARAQQRWLVVCRLPNRMLSAAELNLLMRANYLGGGFGGGWCGLDDLQGCVALHLPLAESEATVDTLLEAVELVLDHAERWERRLEQECVQGAASPMESWAQHI